MWALDTLADAGAGWRVSAGASKCATPTRPAELLGGLPAYPGVKDAVVLLSLVELFFSVSVAVLHCDETSSGARRAAWLGSTVGSNTVGRLSLGAALEILVSLSAVSSLVLETFFSFSAGFSLGAAATTSGVERVNRQTSTTPKISTKTAMTANPSFVSLPIRRPPCHRTDNRGPPSYRHPGARFNINRGWGASMLVNKIPLWPIWHPPVGVDFQPPSPPRSLTPWFGPSGIDRMDTMSIGAGSRFKSLPHALPAPLPPGGRGEA